MKNKPLWAFLIGLFVGLSIVFLNSCGKQVNEPSTKTLTIEYDHQERAWIDPNPDEFSNALSRAEFLQVSSTMMIYYPMNIFFMILPILPMEAIP